MGVCSFYYLKSGKRFFFETEWEKMKSETAKSDTQSRSLYLDVYLKKEDEAKYLKVINSIRHYRHVGRKMFGAVFAAMVAGATTDTSKEGYFRVLPKNENAKKILSDMFAMKNPKDDNLYKAQFYECRKYVLEFLAPTWKAFVWDSLRIQTWDKWKAKDPQMEVSFGYLAANGVRRLAMLNHIGIGFPAAIAHPKFEGHGVTLEWDKEIGPVEFMIRNLDKGRYGVLKKVINGSFEIGTTTLNERDGSLKINLTYDKPVRVSDLSNENTLEVRFSDEMDSAIRIVNDNNLIESINATSAIHWLKRLKAQSDKYLKMKSATGNPNKPWGTRKIFRADCDKLNNVTRCRDNGVGEWNHLWTRRIVTIADSMRCGQITVEKTPESMLGEPWQWFMFKQHLEYKAIEKGIKVLFAS